MIRIVGVQRSPSASEEFVLLQNQGSMRASLRGHVLLSEQAIAAGGASDKIHVFSDEELIPAGMYVLLFSGCGEPKWSKTKEGALVFNAFMGRDSSVWDDSEAIHVLSTQHSFNARREPVMTLR